MALLKYMNLEDVRRQDILMIMNQAYFGFKLIYDYLVRTKRYMESDGAVKRLAWRPVPRTELDDDEKEGVWVQLIEPADRKNEPESTFRAFMEDNLSELYDEGDSQEDEEDGAQEREEQELEQNNKRRFSRGYSITILDREPDVYRLKLDRKPAGKHLRLRPNTYTLMRQLQALQALQNKPESAHRALLRLTEAVDHARWPNFCARPLQQDEWMVLTDPDRDGVGEQRKFVEVALSTPDFAFLEGPPGSGKTTTICELILQLVKQGKRMLLCASTHVAVDNVLERLMDERNVYRHTVIPIRIGDQHSASEKVRPWLLKNFVRTERKRLLHALEGVKELSECQHTFLNELRLGDETVQRMVLDASNLVCGTSIGILQHPSIKNGVGGSIKFLPNFDVLIIDEASKMTFQEFLVPAMLAERWVIVGDVKQLSPYVDDDAMAVNVQACLKHEVWRNACVDVFMAEADIHRRKAAVVEGDSEELSVYRTQAKNGERVAVANADGDQDLWSADIVLGTTSVLDRRSEELPLDTVTVRGREDALPSVRRRSAAFLKRSDRVGEDAPVWEKEIAWRLARHYEQRFKRQQILSDSGRQVKSSAERLWGEISRLLPVEESGIRDDVQDEVDRVRRVALPSILESLQHGFERDPRAKRGTALSDGMPDEALRHRHVLLSWQHRMHPDIAEFSYQHIYQREALRSPERMVADREWSYRRYGRRSVWKDVPKGFNPRTNANPDEALALLEELKRFDQWALLHPRADARPWEVAILTFYRGQEREIRGLLRMWSGYQHGMRSFHRKSSGGIYLSVELCTVDRFQGHEADLVFVSIASNRVTSFLDSPNRLNVALTRARYQRVILGNRNAMRRAKNGLLGDLAECEAWETNFGE